MRDDNIGIDFKDLFLLFDNLRDNKTALVIFGLLIIIVLFFLFFKESINMWFSNHIENKKYLNKRKVEEIRKLKINRSLLQILNNHDFISPFEYKYLDIFNSFLVKYQSDGFSSSKDKRLNKLINSLYESIFSFVNILGEATFPHDDNVDFYYVPPEWKYNDPERYRETVENITKSRKEVCYSLKSFLDYSDKYIED